MQVDKAVFPTLLNNLWRRMNGKNLTGGFRGSGLYPLNKEKPKMKILGSNIQKPIEELDILDRVRAALRTVIIPPQSQETLGAIDNAKGKRRRIQSSSGEVLTEEEVMSRLEAQSIRRHANKRTLSKKSKSSLSNVPMTSLLSSIPENDFPSQCSIMDVPKDGNCFFFVHFTRTV